MRRNILLNFALVFPRLRLKHDSMPKLSDHHIRLRYVRVFLLAVLAILFSAGASSQPLGLPKIDVSLPAPAMVALGKALFFDVKLSQDHTISCASCHQPEKAFSDGLTTAIGIKNQRGTRNTPSLFNVVYSKTLFWEGRRDVLAEQAIDPLLNPIEHGLSDTHDLTERVRSSTQYLASFRAVFGSNKDINAHQIGLALAAYQESLLSAGSPFDRYYYGGQEEAISHGAKKGFELFRSRAGCANCHVVGTRDALFTDHKYHSLGIGKNRIENLAKITTLIFNANAAEQDILIKSNTQVAELGRFVVTKEPSDIGKFKTPSLRNVALTAPFMHDGSIATLEDAVEFELRWSHPGGDGPIILTPQEQRQLIEFLLTLTSAPHSSH